MKKICIHCGKEKALEDFVKNKTGKMDRENRCKECQKKQRKEYYLSHRDKEIKNARTYQGEHKERLAYKHRIWARANAKKLGIIVQEWKRRNKERKTFYSLQYRNKYPQKIRAQALLNNAIRKKKIDRQQICQECGSGGKIEGHHPDYSKPLEVIWLCQSCHNKLNRIYA